MTVSVTDMTLTALGIYKLITTTYTLGSCHTGPGNKAVNTALLFSVKNLSINGFDKIREGLAPGERSY